MIAVVPFVTCVSALTVQPGWMREAEKKHGRVAMLSLPTLAAISMANHGMDPGPWLNAQPVSTQLVFYSTAGLLESANLRRFGKGFTLKEGETPGQLWGESLPPSSLETVEDWSGRVGMLASAGMLLDGLVSQGM